MVCGLKKEGVWREFTVTKPMTDGTIILSHVYLLINMMLSIVNVQACAVRVFVGGARKQSGERSGKIEVVLFS